MLFQHSKVSIARLTEHVLSIAERSQLELGLPYSFIKKKEKKNQHKFRPANLESICLKVNKDVEQDMKEEFHEFLGGYTDIFYQEY